MSPNEWLDAEGSPAFDFPIAVGREDVLAALDTIPSQRDRQTLVTALNGAASAWRALTIEARDERASHVVALRELGSGIKRVVELVGDSDDPTIRAELAWLTSIATAAMRADG